MLKNKAEGKGLGQKAVKSMASLARGIAKDSAENRCWFFMHQPKEPKDLAQRVQKLQKK